VLLIQEINLRQRIRYNDETREQLTEQIRDEEKRKESILAQKEYMETDDYIREIARDYLGLVDEDDIILKERNEP
jgi:cell division protein DivIC